MITLYSDEDVDIQIKPLLEAKGYRVLTTQGEQNLGSSDKEQLDYAIKNGYVFLTHNVVDFEKLIMELHNEGRSHPGIILASRKNIYNLSKNIAKKLSQYTQETIENQVIYT